MKCPKCNNPISPLKVWLISRWSFVKCKKCGTRSGRKVNIQFFMISVLFFSGYLIFNISLLFIIWALIVMYIDAYTIRLVPKDEQDGI
jgi:prepilin signal peptidase PulO-like enzyme (type II secretory pathway)